MKIRVIFVILLFCGCDIMFTASGRVVIERNMSLNSFPMKLMVDVDGRHFERYTTSDGQFNITINQKGNNISIYLVDSLFTSDTVRFTWDEYFNDKLWDKKIILNAKLNSGFQ